MFVRILMMENLRDGKVTHGKVEGNWQVTSHLHQNAEVSPLSQTPANPSHVRLLGSFIVSVTPAQSVSSIRAEFGKIKSMTVMTLLLASILRGRPSKHCLSDINSCPRCHYNRHRRLPLPPS